MKLKDIKPGVAYAYQDSKSRQAGKIIFLAVPGESIRLYRETAWRAGSDKHAFTRSRETRPQSGQSDVWTRQAVHGYPAVQIHLAYGEQPEPDLTAVTWDDFLAVTVATTEDKARGIKFILVTRLACVLGPWDEVMAAEAQRKQAEQADRDKRETERRDRKRRAAMVVATLEKLGIDSFFERGDSNRYAVSMELDAAEKLAELINEVAKTGEVA